MVLHVEYENVDGHGPSFVSDVGVGVDGAAGAGMNASVDGGDGECDDDHGGGVVYYIDVDNFLVLGGGGGGGR